jgi:glyoxylase-like metal-dependent hydrolase (beta-lactamase superfamily II)
MLELDILPVGPYGTNCYLLTCPRTDQALLVDPAGDPDRLLAACQGKQVTRILLTHGHFDHLMALSHMQEALGVPVGIHPADAAEFGVDADLALQDGMRLGVGRQFLRVVHIPGHTSGSVALRFDRRALVGDAIFPGGPGATRSPQALQTSLLSLQRTVFTWPDDTHFYPGHGDSGTVGAVRPAFQKFLARPRSPDLCGDVTWETGKG